MKFSELINANHHIILVLPRFGIALGCGEKSVEEVCEQYGIDVKFFLLVCNAYTFDSVPDNIEFEEADMSGLIPYLLACHKYYLEENIPHIAHHLEHIAAVWPEKDAKLLRGFFECYRNEIINHFKYEEEVVFPYINKLTAGERDNSFSIEQFEENHSNIEDKLSDLTNIIIKYSPGSVISRDHVSVLLDLYRFAEDLDKHTLIENKILVPYVELLEVALE